MLLSHWQENHVYLRTTLLHHTPKGVYIANPPPVAQMEAELKRAKEEMYRAVDAVKALEEELELQSASRIKL